MAGRSKGPLNEDAPVDLAKLREEVEVMELRARKLEALVRSNAAKQSLAGSRAERGKDKAKA